MALVDLIQELKGKADRLDLLIVDLQAQLRILESQRADLSSDIDMIQSTAIANKVIL